MGHKKVPTSAYPVIATRYRSGETLQEIGDSYGVTRELVRIILRMQHVSAEEGGLAVRRRQKLERERAERDGRWFKKYGITFAERQKILEQYGSGPFTQYRQQQRNAERREIPWQFTFRAWWDVWKRSGKWEQRGREIGQYVMSRPGDQGPYSPDNVRIVTCSENVSEVRRREAA